ncbi:MAG: ABC transporter ATP-binding protein [Actinomycetota bacterium]|nr:ABC transporter ATP-binding protein [Actinomycetota bacterium]
MNDRAPTSDDPALSMDRVRFERNGTVILDDVSWQVTPGQRWALLGRNGSGKTTLVRIASLYEHPTSGTVHVLGERLGRVDVRRHRERIGLTSPALADQLRATTTARDVVVSGIHAALETWWHTYDDDELARADERLARLGVAHLAERTFGTLSSGERQRVLLARTLISDPGLLLLDEPTAGLDLAGREQLVATLALLAADASAPPMVLVTHHPEEIPPGTTHVLLLSGGRVLAAGPLEETLTSASLSACFGLPLLLERSRNGRFAAFAAD